MDKTFAETQGIAPFDWNKALDDVISVSPDNDTCNYLANKAESWVTCACGNQCAIIPRYDDEGEPRDCDLADLGYKFYSSVGAKNFIKAKTILRDIEARSAILIKQELN